MSESKYSTQGQQKSQRERAKTFPSMDDYYENSFLRNWQLKGRRKVFDLSHRNAAAAAAKLLQSCLTLCDPIDGSPPGSPIPGILQARTLEWVAISFSKLPYLLSFATPHKDITIKLTICLQLYLSSLWLIHFVAGSLYLLISTYFSPPPPPLWQLPVCSLFLWLCFCCSFVF